MSRIRNTNKDKGIFQRLLVSLFSVYLLFVILKEILNQQITTEKE